MATSVGGVLTGRGADFILIDDPMKPSDAMSESRRAGVNEWYDNTLYSRLNDKNKGAIVIVMQRLHEDDLVGHVLKQEGWEVISLPAIAEVDERFVVTTPFGERRYSRRVGEALHPERESLATLDQIRRTLGEYNFAGQYQQTPAPAGGGMVKEAWFRRYKPEDQPQTIRPSHPELGHGKQAERACRLFGLHDLGLQGVEFLSAECLSQEALLSGSQACCCRTEPAVQPNHHPHRGQSLWNPAHPGADRCRHVESDTLQAGRRQDHAPALTNGDDREWLRPSADRGALAARLPQRADDVSERAL